MVEWLDPVMVVGHWLPEMVERVGGVNLITKTGQKFFPIIINQIVKQNQIHLLLPLAVLILKEL